MRGFTTWRGACSWVLVAAWLAVGGCAPGGGGGTQPDGGSDGARGGEGGSPEAGRPDGGYDGAGGEPDAASPDGGTGPRDGGGPTEDAGPPGDAGGPDGGDDLPTGAVQLIGDRHFRRGFQVLHPDSGDPVGAIQPGFEPGGPLWRLAQWGSRASLATAAPEALSSGAVRWANPYAEVLIGPAGSPEGDLIFHVDAFEEYGGVYRTGSESRTWPHLLAEQRLSAPGAAGPGCPPLSELAALPFRVEARLHFDRRNLGSGYDASRHAAQFLIYFTVQNLASPSAPGYGDYLWLGVTLYDDRDPRPGLYVNGDVGTGKLIYNLGLSTLSSETLSDGAWHVVEGDLLPHAVAALREAWRRGFLPDSHDLADYRIGGMNIGWEIPGLNEARMQVRNLSLAYVPRDGGGGSGPVRRFGFDRDGDREGWSTRNLLDPDGGPRGGTWRLTVPGSDPMLVSPTLGVPAAEVGTVRIRMANDGNPAAASRMQLFWEGSAVPSFTEASSRWVDVRNDGSWQVYTFDVRGAAGWSGTISRLRIDPVMEGSGRDVRVDWIELGP